MIVNLTSYVKENFFKELDINYCVVWDSNIETNKDCYKFELNEPIWQIVDLAWKYDFVFVVIDKINYENIYRLYSYDIKNVCIFNLNSGYSWIWKKLIEPDLDDIYIKSNVKVFEPIDLNSLKTYINKFTKDNFIYHIRVPFKDLEEKMGNDEIDLKYETIVNFDEFNISGYSWTFLVYGSLLPEMINVSWSLKWEWLNFDMFWVWDFKLNFSSELIKSLENQDRIFIVWDFDKKTFKDLIYSNFYKAWIEEKEIFFITPENLKLETIMQDYIGEQVWIDVKNIYEKIKKQLDEEN